MSEELDGQRKLDEGMEASFEGTCKLWKVKDVIGFPKEIHTMANC